MRATVDLSRQVQVMSDVQPVQSASETRAEYPSHYRKVFAQCIQRQRDRLALRFATRTKRRSGLQDERPSALASAILDEVLDKRPVSGGEVRFIRSSLRTASDDIVHCADGMLRWHGNRQLAKQAGNGRRLRCTISRRSSRPSDSANNSYRSSRSKSGQLLYRTPGVPR